MPFLHRSTIGGLTVANNLALAPLSGTSDRSFRLLCHDYGAGLMVTELVSARGICHDARLTPQLALPGYRPGGKAGRDPAVRLRSGGFPPGDRQDRGASAAGAVRA